MATKARYALLETQQTVSNIQTASRPRYSLPTVVVSTSARIFVSSGMPSKMSVSELAMEPKPWPVSKPTLLLPLIPEHFKKGAEALMRLHSPSVPISLH